jgi:hypothetical protein
MMGSAKLEACRARRLQHRADEVVIVDAGPAERAVAGQSLSKRSDRHALDCSVDVENRLRAIQVAGRQERAGLRPRDLVTEPGPPLHRRIDRLAALLHVRAELHDERPGFEVEGLARLEPVNGFHLEHARDRLRGRVELGALDTADFVKRFVQFRGRLGIIDAQRERKWRLRR